jgi:SCP-2 sterol transfer family
MPQFLTPGWLEAMSAAAGGAAVPVIEPTIVVQQVVIDAEGAEVTWWLALGGGIIVLRAGRAEDPTVTFTQDAETAAAINRGELSAQAAFMTGRLRVNGDVQVLLDRQAELVDVDDVFAAIRTATTYR